MFLSFYTFIIILLVKVISNVNVIECRQSRSFENFQNKVTLSQIKHNVNEAKIKKSNIINKEAQLFEHIYEENESTTQTSITSNPTLYELQSVLQKLLDKLNRMDFDKEIITSTTKFVSVKRATSVPLARYQYDANKRSKWGEWTNWSYCSVSCGKGRKIRWRHCEEDCDTAETEMEEKTCQLPACGPGKIFGIKF